MVSKTHAIKATSNYKALVEKLNKSVNAVSCAKTPWETGKANAMVKDMKGWSFVKCLPLMPDILQLQLVTATSKIF